MTVTLAAIRRYPVKAMGGEDLAQVDVDARGLLGDRWFAVVDDDGRLASHKSTTRMRRRDAVARFHALTGDDGVVQVGDERGGSRPVDDPALAAQLSEAMGAPVTVRVEQGGSHQDDGAVSLVGSATLRWCAERWGVDADPRRLRVNLVLDTDEPFVEESWLGRRVGIGPVGLLVQDRVERCRTVDVDQDGVVVRDRWLAPLGAERDLCVAVYARVVQPGLLTLGDPVEPQM
ncbi:MOSC domain-containing protein [Jannaschia sp. R86511]|uniref:MOSC domain-containing protein n=1 Tax=Jannaschia sp. R86511 TaxID=3093853 RepID=UPI0036D22147